MGGTPKPYLDSLTTMRGIAAWWVACYHFRQLLPAGLPYWLMGGLANGDLAVDFFFQLSGFIIAYNYITQLDRVSWRSYTAFIVKRLARIYPLHIFVLLLYVLNPIAILLFSTQGLPGDRYSLSYFLLSVVLMQNWGFTDALAWNVPAWSISTEWFVYLVFPLIAGSFLHFFSDGRRALFGFLLLWAVLGAIWYHQGVALGGDISRLGLARCVIQFLMGATVQRMLAHRPDVARLLAAPAIVLGVLLLLAWVLFDPLPDYAVIPGVWALWIYGFAANTGIGARLGRWRVGVAIGEASYSTYLIHFFVLDWVKFLLVRAGGGEVRDFLVCIALTVVMSWVLYRFVEVPGRRWGRSLAERRVVRHA